MGGKLGGREEGGKKMREEWRREVRGVGGGPLIRKYIYLH